MAVVKVRPRINEEWECIADLVRIGLIPEMDDDVM